MNDRVSIHEFVEISGLNRARYVHHMTANWSPNAQEAPAGSASSSSSAPHSAPCEPDGNRTVTIAPTGPTDRENRPMSHETISFTTENGVGWVTLDRAERHNAFDETMQQELSDLWRSLREDDDVRCIVLTAAGDKSFCTGIDRSEIPDDGRPSSTRTGGTTPASGSAASPTACSRRSSLR